MPFLAHSQVGLRSPDRSPSASVVAVDISVDKWLEDYMGWTRHHPEIKVSASSTSDPEPVMLGMPYLELFSPTGASLYRGSNAAQNAFFLRALERKVPSRASVSVENGLHPTLKEYFDMIAELRPYQAEVRSKKCFIILAITYPDKSFCKVQNDALDKMKKTPNIRVIEVRLHL